MGRASIKVTVVFLLLGLGIVNAQVTIDLKKSKSPFAYDPVIVVDIHDVVSKGIFIELQGDSITMLLNSRIETVAINSLKHLKIFSSHETRHNMFNMGIAGAFFVQLLLNKNDWQSDRYIRSDGLGQHILVGVLGAVGGGLIGLGVDLAQSDKELEYNLQYPQDVNKLKNDITGPPDEPKLNFYYEIASVYTRVDPTSNQGQSGYYSDSKVTLNTFRSLKLTYDVTDRVEAGFALYSAAEPNLRYSFSSQYSYGDRQMNNRVYGYYAMAYYDILGRPRQSAFALKPGLGIGFVNLDYSINWSNRSYDPVTYESTTTRGSSNLSKTLFSGFLAIDARLYTLTGVSVSFTADYVYIPEKTLPSELAGEGGKSFSNFSLGLSLGIHL